MSILYDCLNTECVSVQAGVEGGMSITIGPQHWLL